MSEIKPCKVCNFTRQKYSGVAVVSLEELRVKGSQALGYSAGTAVSVVLDDDGTFVEDEAYFLCLPSNTKFMLLRDEETWKPAKRYDGGAAWMTMQSFDSGSDTVDSDVEPWRRLAEQLRQDLASVILMSEADLETLVAVPCADLASALTFPEQKTQHLQDSFQRVLDRREEERQSRQLLQLYLKVVEKEGRQNLHQGETMRDETDGDEVNPAVGFSRTLLVLKDKTSPETRLSNEELQMVLTQGVETMMDELDWDRDRTAVLLQACEEELSKRLRQVQAMQSLSAHSQCDSSSSTLQPHDDNTTSKRRR